MISSCGAAEADGAKQTAMVDNETTIRTREPALVAYLHGGNFGLAT